MLLLQLYKHATSFLVMIASKLGKTQGSIAELSATAAPSWGSIWNSIRVFLLTYVITYSLLMEPDHQLKLQMCCSWQKEKT